LSHVLSLVFNDFITYFQLSLQEDYPHCVCQISTTIAKYLRQSSDKKKSLFWLTFFEDSFLWSIGSIALGLVARPHIMVGVHNNAKLFILLPELVSLQVRCLQKAGGLYLTLGFQVHEIVTKKIFRSHRGSDQESLLVKQSTG
jgi:hypothetical protein